MPSSLLFTEPCEPHLATPDTRILSLAMHVLCSLCHAGIEIREGKKEEDAMKRLAAAVATHTLNLYPTGAYNGLDDLMKLAGQRGLTLSPDLDLNARVVLQ